MRVRIIAGGSGSCLVIVAALWAGEPADKRASAGANDPALPPATQPATQPAEPALYAGQRPDEWSSYQAMHAYFLKRFVESRGFGLERVVNMKDPRNYKVYADATRYRVGTLQLISLNGGKEPFAYKTSLDSDKERIKHAPHEPLWDGESEALAKLKDGAQVVLTGPSDRREMVGAIRATSECMKCHDVPNGTLLGAFRYPLYVAPDPAPRQ